MLHPEKMKKLDLLVFDASIDRVTEGIIAAGLLHPVEVCQLERWAETLKAGEDGRVEDWSQPVAQRASEILDRLGSPAAPAEPAVWEPVEKKTAEEIVGEAEKRLNPLFLDREARAVELKTQQRMLAEVKTFALDKLGFSLQGKYTFLEMELGRLSEANLPFLEDSLKPIPHVLLPVQAADRMVTVLVMVLRKDRAVLEKAIEECRFTKAELPAGRPELNQELTLKIQSRIEEIDGEIAAIDEKISREKEKVVPGLQRLGRQLQIGRMIDRAKSFFRKTRRTYLITGWVPGKKVGDLVSRVRDLSGGRCYVEVQDPEEVPGVKEGMVKVPVALANPAFFKPFELLIHAYGLPDYRSIDPTPVAAITFLIMFGAMFGDVGHGLLLGLVGLVLGRWPKFRKPGMLALYCGISSIVFGLLFGSFFGYENILPPLWFRPMRNIFSVITAAILFGVAVITIGIVFNIINALRNRRFVDALFNESGLIGGLIYWIGAGLAIKLLKFHSPTALPWVAVLLGAPAVLWFFKGPFEKIMLRRDRAFPEGFGIYFMESLIELGITFIGYLANTISFVRIAAFALAHVGLFIAVFSLADMLKTDRGTSPASILVLVIGNLAIVGLEGLVVTIQSVRLEYYEFFSKFLSESHGTAYRPLILEK